MGEARFDAFLETLAPAGGPGAAVAVRLGDEVIHSGAHGLANVEWGVPIDTDTVFRIGSITKQFTAAAILRLAAEGLLAIDDPIERHLPDYPVGERRITVRHLLNHTSGIKSYSALPNLADFVRKDLSLSELIDVFKATPPDFAPGERYLYNNSGYILLGAIIEALSGESYEAYLAETFFEPLGLTRTCYLHEAPIVPKRASGYAMTPGLRNAPPLSMNLPHAAGALGSTVGDLLAWEKALRSGKAVSPDDYTAMTTPGRLDDGTPLGYGFGLTSQLYRGHRIVGHSGGINGFLSDLLYWPEHDLTVVVLSNSSAFPVQQASYGLARLALGLEDLVRETIPSDAAELEACAGVYRFELGLVASLKVKEGQLTAQFPRPGSVFLPFGPGAFHLATDPEVTLRFGDPREGVYQRVDYASYSSPNSARRIPRREPASATPA